MRPRAVMRFPTDDARRGRRPFEAPDRRRRRREVSRRSAPVPVAQLRTVVVDGTAIDDGEPPYLASRLPLRCTSQAIGSAAREGHNLMIMTYVAMPLRPGVAKQGNVQLA